MGVEKPSVAVVASAIGADYSFGVGDPNAPAVFHPMQDIILGVAQRGHLQRI
jgi:hypothetical protein